MGLDDFAPADDSAFDPNEDLFEFPGDLGSPEPDAAAPFEGLDEDLGASPLDLSDDVLDSFDAPMPSVDPDSDHADRDLGAALDFDPDEDLFGFPPLEQPEPERETDDGSAAAPERSTDRPRSPVNDLLEDDLDDMIRETQAEQQREATPAPEHEPRAPLPSSRHAAPRREDPPYPAGAPAQAQAVPVAAGSPLALWVLTTAVIFFMVGLLGIAWRATSSFQNQLETVRAEVQAQATELEQGTAAGAAQLLQLQAELERERRAVQSQAGDPQPGVKASPVEAAHERDLFVARELLDEGQFDDSRRVLFGLLAEADRLPADARAGVEEEARFLIARSYVTEAETLPGGPE